MTILNWNKHRFNKVDTSTLVGGSDYKFFKDNNLWTLKGKHYGTHIHKLPMQYLFWITENITGSHKQQATDELYRRAAELDN